MTIIGVSGYASAGKDTFADALVSELGFVKVSFADPMREALVALDPTVAVWEYGKVYTAALSALMSKDGYGWRDLKDASEGPDGSIHPQSARALLQRLGTEVGRNLLGADLWVDKLLSTLDQSKSYVIPDVRFPNEAGAIQEAGGFIVRVDRPGNEAANTHPSEKAMDNYAFDAKVANRGTMDSFQGLAVIIAESFTMVTPPL